jgi:hypothetical protein
MNQPHIVPLDPKPGAPEALKQPTRIPRWIDNTSWFELEPSTMAVIAYGEVGEQHPDLREGA